MNGDGGKAFRRRIFRAARKAVYPDVTEAPEGQFRFIGLAAFPAGIAILCLGAAVIFRIEIAFFIQDFRKGKIQYFSCRCLQNSFHIAGHFLAEVDDSLSIGRGETSGSGDPFLLPDLFALLRNQCIPGAVEALNRIVHGRLISCIVDLSVIDFGEAYFTLGYRPGFIGGKDFSAPILVSDF